MAINIFSQLTSKIYGAIAIAAIVVAGAQTLRIDGAFCRDVDQGERPACVFQGFKQDVAELELDVADRAAERDLERAQHATTKEDYRFAQEQARLREEARLARVAAEQKEITDAVVLDYRQRLAAARAHAERLREELRARADAAGAPGGERVPGAGDAAGGAAEAPGDRRLSLDERLIATEQALQLDALIDWVERQFAVDVNLPTER